MSGGRRTLSSLLIACALAIIPAFGCGAAGLPGLRADLSQTSVSGLSSGGYMAGQFQVAHSATVIGAGIVAAGPFGCAKNEAGWAIPFAPAAAAFNIAQAENGCMADRLSFYGVLDSSRLLKLATSLASDGKIDPVAGLKPSKVYLFIGADDRVIAKPVVEAARNFYLAAGVPASNIEFISNEPGGHAFLTAATGAACPVSDPPYVNNCHYDQGEAILRWIYGPLAPKADARDEGFQRFDQGSYASTAEILASEGVVYIPAACRSSGGCRVHVVFHGCKQSLAEIGDAFVRGSGFADWAEANRIIVLYPQAAASALNPNGCWDWWGYTALDYLSKEAPQIEAVFAMISRLAKG